MKLDRYECKFGDKFLTYEFLSEGPKGKIKKLNQFTLVNENSLYTLAFGDKNSETGELGVSKKDLTMETIKQL